MITRKCFFYGLSVREVGGGGEAGNVSRPREQAFLKNRKGVGDTLVLLHQRAHFIICIIFLLLHIIVNFF